MLIDILFHEIRSFTNSSTMKTDKRVRESKTSYVSGEKIHLVKPLHQPYRFVYMVTNTSTRYLFPENTAVEKKKAK